MLGTLEAHKQCFLFWANFHNRVRQKEEGAQGEKGSFLYQMAQDTTLWEEKKSKVALFRE